MFCLKTPLAAPPRPAVRAWHRALLGLVLGVLGCTSKSSESPAAPAGPAVAAVASPAPQPAAAVRPPPAAEARPLALSEPPPPEPELAARVERAAAAAAAGHLTHARAELAGVPADAQGFHHLLFVRACMALEAGDWEGASHDVGRLRQAVPGRPEPRLLEALLELRRNHPELSWRAAFLRAWNETGRADMRSSAFFAKDIEPAGEGLGVEEAWQRAREPGVRGVLALALPRLGEVQVRELLQQAPSLEDGDLAAAAWQALGNAEVPAELSTRAAAALRTRLSELAAASPDTQQLRLLLLVGATPPQSPLSTQELAALEGIAALPRWRKGEQAALYQRVVRALQAAGVANARSRALTVAIQARVASLPTRLLERARATRGGLSAEQLRGLGQLLWRIGSRLAAEPTILERFVGLELMKQGALDMQDEERLAQAAVILQEDQAMLEASRRAALGRWPLHSMLVEMLEASTRDEREHLQGFLPPERRAKAGR